MMTYKGYKADIKYDSDANTFYGEILNSSAIIHCRGDSVQELVKSFQEGVDEYLAACEIVGMFNKYKQAWEELTKIIDTEIKYKTNIAKVAENDQHTVHRTFIAVGYLMKEILKGE